MHIRFSGMETFDLAAFVVDPSMAAIEKCKKRDLFAIAEHYQVPVQRAMVKAVLRDCVVDVLMGRKVLDVEITMVPPGSEASAGTLLSPCGRVEAGVEAKPQATLPRYDPFSPSSASSLDARLKVRLARLELERQQGERAERQAEREHTLEMCRIEAGLQMKRLELEAANAAHSPQTTHMFPGSVDPVEIGRLVGLVPPFCESEIDSYFSSFERVAVSQRWPKDVWPVLL